MWVRSAGTSSSFDFMGLPTIGLKGNKIVKTYPDGREEVLKVLDTHNEKDHGPT